MIEQLESRRLMAVTVVEYPIASLASQIYGIAPGVNGNVWFTATSPAEVGVFNSTSRLSAEFPINIANSRPEGVIQGADDNVYFADNGTSSIGVFDPDTFETVEYPTPTSDSQPMGITVAADGTIWFTANAAGKIGEFDPTTRHITEYALRDANSGPMDIIPGPDGMLWFTESSAIGQIDPSDGKVVETAAPGVPSAGLTVGPDNQVWFSYEFSTMPGLETLGFAEIDPSNLHISSYPTDQTYNTGFPSQEGFTTGPDGHLYLTELSQDSGNESVIGEYDTTAHALGYVYATNPPGGTHGSLVYSIAAGPADNLYFGDTGAVGVATVVPADQSAIQGSAVQANPPAGTRVALAGRTVFVDLKGDGMLDPGDPSAVTDANGDYQITGLAIGSYKVRVVGYPGDFTSPVSVTTAGGGISAEIDPTVQPSTAVLPLALPSDPFGASNPDLATAEVTGLYQIILGRAPDPSGLAFYTAYLKGGGSLQYLAGNILGSREYETDLVASYYENYLGRAGSPAEIAAWVGQMQAGFTAEQVTYLFMTSPEYSVSHADNASFIESLYGTLLGRAPSAPEVSAWESYLSGSSRATLVNLFLHSTGAYQRSAQGFYAEFLASPADPTGEALIVSALSSGQTLADVASTFASSPAYIARANASVG